jgi:transposase-like protein
LPRPWPYKRLGFFYRAQPPHRIQRYQCLACRRSFSSQTFSPTYWLKRPDLFPRLFFKTIGAMANRQIARDLAVSPATVDRQLSRLGRHCLLLHRLLAGTAKVDGPLVIDGFESFEYSQYFPFHHNLAVEAATGFFVHFTDSPLRRKGRMRPAQRRRRAQLEERLGRPDPKAVESGIRELLQVALAGVETVQLRRDDHPAYPRAMRDLPQRIIDQVTPSTARRDADNDLFEVNLLDLLIRHSSANHRRETIAWSKRRQRSAERLAVLLVWRNYVKRRWEKGPPQTPAMLKGLVEKPLRLREILARRLFPSRIALPGIWADYYWGRVLTRALPVNRRHALRYAV